jgi:hypothetical protein
MRGWASFIAVLAVVFATAVLTLETAAPARAQVEFVPDRYGRQWVPKPNAQQRRTQPPPATARGQRPQQGPSTVNAPPPGVGFFPWFIPRQTIPATTPNGTDIEVVVREGDGTITGLPGQSGQFFCVRLCDGFYFPLPPEVRAANNEQRQMVCAGMCRGADTRLFQRTGGGGSEVEHELGEALTSAVGRPVPYTKLPAAFRYRDALVPGCGCQSPAAEASAAAKAEETTPARVLPVPVFLSRSEDPDTVANRTALTRPLNDGGSQAEAEALANAAPRKVRIVGPSYFVAQ